MAILLWLMPYYEGTWNYIALSFYVGVAVGLIHDVYSTLRQAHREHREEKDFTEINDRIFKNDTIEEAEFKEIAQDDLDKNTSSEKVA